MVTKGTLVLNIFQLNVSSSAQKDRVKAHEGVTISVD